MNRFLILILIIFTQCDTKWESKYSDLHNKQLEFSFINESDKFELDSGKKIIINVVTASCISCVEELQYWEKFIEQHDLKEKVNLLFVAQGKRTFYFNKKIYLNSDFTIPIIYDPDSSFIKNNQMELLFSEHTVVSDSSGSILYLGSPILYPSKKKSFLQILSQ